MDYLNTITGPSMQVLGLPSIFKLMFLVIVFGYLIYVLLLTLRTRILNDTVLTASNKKVTALVYLHLFVAIVGSLIAVILILIG